MNIRILTAILSCLLSTPFFISAHSKEREFQLTVPAGYSLAGSIHYPYFGSKDSSKQKLPVVILISGSGKQDRNAEKFGGNYQPINNGETHL